MKKALTATNKILLAGSAGSLAAKIILLPLLIQKNKEITPQLIAVGIPFIAVNAAFVWNGYKK